MPSTSPEERTCRVNGIDMRVAISGEGPPVLLLHGFPDTHTLWRHQVPVLIQAGYQVIAPDTRGCGETQMMPRESDYHIDHLVADLLGLLDALKIDKVRLVGHDWGAMQAWHFVLRHPDRVHRFIALSVGHPHAYAHGGFEQKLKGYYVLILQLRGIAETLARAFDWAVFRMVARYPAEVERWKAQLSRPGRLTAGMNYYRANFGWALGGGGERVKVPVVCIWSSKDIFLTEGQMLKTRDYCDAGYTYERVEGANHWLQLTAPDQVNALLLEYLR